MNHLNFIKTLGFRRVGMWHIKDVGIVFEVEPTTKKKKWILYAFVVGTKVLYLGKSTMAFGKRLNGYKRPGSTQQTNKRINPRIAELIRSNKTVSIYCFEGSPDLEFKGMKLNLAAALEDPLIERISPEWNMNGRAKQPKNPKVSTIHRQK